MQGLAASTFSIAAILTVLLFAAGCATKTEKIETQATISPPVQNLTAALEDEVHDVPDGKIEWSTYWHLCWANYEGASAYELQALTSEGSSDKLERQSDRCFRLQVAAGKNARTQGMLNRDLQLAIRSSQLAYRVRAVLADGQFSEWSKPLSVAKATTGDAR